MHQPYLDPVTAAQEYGAPLPEARDQSPLPPGGGRLVVPHYMTFSALVNLASRTYRWTFDEALRHNKNNALAIRRDPVVMDALRSRQIPTAQLPWHIDCQDDQDSRQAEAVQTITEIIESIPNFQRLKMHLLEALWWGRYGVQLTWAWDWTGGARRLKVVDHRPINGDKLHFKYDGSAGVLVHATFPGTWEQTDRGRAHFFSPEDRERVLIHRHEPEDADFFEPELAGQVEGVGIRSRIYWFWWLRSQVSAFLMDYLERVGAGGFTIYYYEHGNKTSLDEVKAAAEEQHRQNTILFPRYKDGSTGGPGIQRLEPSNSGAQLLQSLISGYFDEVIRRYILGQNLTSEARGTGMGSGVADLHADTFSRLVKYDAVNLGETLTTDLVWVIQKYLFPGLPPMRLVFDVDKPNARDVLESAQAFYGMGGTVDEDELRSIIGLAKPQPGHSILAKMGNLSPAGMPTGVPMMGAPGPDAMGMDATGPGGMDGMGAPMMMNKGEARRGRRVRRYNQSRGLEADPRLLDLTRSYLARHGLPEYKGDQAYLPVDEARAKRIADFYHSAKHAPADPRVRRSYDAMGEETLRQYQWAKEQGGVEFEPWEDEGQPYANSQDMRDDARGGHLYYYTGGDHPGDSLPHRPSRVQGRSHNDLFRAVHDLYGHALHGNQFGPRGEEHAWRTHSKMYSPEAKPAMSAETRGQNSWVNYGPHMRRPDGSVPRQEDSDWVPHPQRRFAEQKSVLLPDEYTVD